jgi:hypothetical protein
MGMRVDVFLGVLILRGMNAKCFMNKLGVHGVFFTSLEASFAAAGGQ